MNVNIVKFSDTYKNDKIFRLDSEHYQQHYIDNQNKISKFGCKKLGELILDPVITGHTPSKKIESYYNGEIALVKTDNVRNFKITGDFTDYLTVKGNNKIKNSSLKDKDLVMTIIGAEKKIVGRSALINQSNLPANINQNVALIRLKKDFQPEIISAYLNSKTGRNATWYQSRQTEQVNLNCREIEEILIPLFSKNFTQLIQSKYTEVSRLNRNIQTHFYKANEILLKEIGLDKWKLKNDLTFENKFSSIINYRRLDAEYFQPKYERIIHLLKNKNKVEKILDQFDLNNSNFKIEKELEYKYVEISSINIFNSEITPIELYGENLPANAKLKLNKNDLIISKVRPYRGAISIVDQENLIGSGAFTALTENGLVNKESLFIYLRSKPILHLINKFNTGIEYPVIINDDVMNFPLPLIEKQVQQNLKEIVTEILQMNKEINFYLQEFSVSIDMAIEKNEVEAMQYLDNKKLRF